MGAKRKRWVCPLCEVGVLGPLRPRKDNAVRYCLPCTEKTGKLTERVAPADLKKKERKAQQKEEAKQRKAEKRKDNPKPRTTKRSWMRVDRYVFSYGGRAFNIMEMAEKMCASTRWDAVVKKAAKKTHTTLYNCTANRTLRRLWEQTMSEKGAQGNRGGIRITRNNKGHATGRGGQNYGVTMGATPHDIADTMMTLLHELTHVAHLSQVRAARINDKRRPHDLMFNIIQWQMAKNFWGYDVHPYTAGYSVGRGYSPSRHLRQWLRERLKEGDPNVMKWFTMEAPPEKESSRPPRQPKWEITRLNEATVQVNFTPGLWSIFNYTMECPSDEDRIRLREALDNNHTKKGKGYLVDIPVDLLPTLESEVQYAQGLDSVLNEPSEYRGTARLLHALERMKQGIKWSARGASFKANYYWGDPYWSGGVEEPFDPPSEDT